MMEICKEEEIQRQEDQCESKEREEQYQASVRLVEELKSRSAMFRLRNPVLVA